MDWFEANPAIVNFVPRGQSFPEIDLPGEIHWKNEYAFIGAGYKGNRLPINYFDGINENGLSAAALWLSCSEYPATRFLNHDSSGLHFCVRQLFNLKILKRL